MSAPEFLPPIVVVEASVTPMSSNRDYFTPMSSNRTLKISNADVTPKISNRESSRTRDPSPIGGEVVKRDPSPTYVVSKKKRTKYNTQVDIWSLGCIVYNLFTGVPPFFEAAREELFEKINNCQWNDNVPDPYYFQEDDGSDAFAFQ